MALQHAESKSKRHAAKNGQPARNRHTQKKPQRQSITVQRCITCRCCVSRGKMNFHRPLYRSSCQQSTGSGPLSNVWLRSKMYEIDCHHCTLDWRRCASFRRSCARSGGKRLAAFVSVIKRAYGFTCKVQTNSKHCYTQHRYASEKKEAERNGKWKQTNLGRETQRL